MSGLDIGSSVNFRGVRVGSVRRISFIGAEYGEGADRDDRKKIYVEISFDARLFTITSTQKPRQVLEDMIAHGLHATVSASGVTGLSHIELDFPKGELKDERPSWRPAPPQIPPAPSILQSAADSATQILNQLNKMDIAAVWADVASSVGAVAKTMESAQAISSIEILDFLGCTLYRQEGGETVDVNLPAGAYLVKVVTVDGNTSVQKLMVK